MPRLLFIAALLLTSLAALAWLLSINLTAGIISTLALVCGASAAYLLAQNSPRFDARPDAQPTETALADALLEATMNSMREGVLVVNETMQVVAANHAARQTFAVSGEAASGVEASREAFGGADGELTAKRLTELTRSSEIHHAFVHALEHGELAETKVEMPDRRSRAGERRTFDLRVAPLVYSASRDGAGTSQHKQQELRGAIGVFFDITRLERLERVRQEFLSNVSHELRTPLTAILTFIETLEAGAIDDEAHNRQFLQIIRRNAERMHALINDILELSAIEAGNVQVERGRVPLHALVGDVLTALESRAKANEIKLINRVEKDASVNADARRLDQMLTNLVDNAIKFNRHAGSITITHERRNDADHISVTDTGEGIAPEHTVRIFERFYRVDRARSRALGGTGLGLAIVKHLARAHGGEASVTSTLGHGSTFTIELPVENR